MTTYLQICPFGVASEGGFAGRPCSSPEYSADLGVRCLEWSKDIEPGVTERGPSKLLDSRGLESVDSLCGLLMSLYP